MSGSKLESVLTNNCWGNYNLFIHFEHMTTEGGFKWYDHYYVVLSDIKESMLDDNFEMEIKI